jgi:hypothetical protein
MPSSSPQLITSLHSKRYQPSAILIHQQNSYVPRGKQCPGRHEAHSREAVTKVKKNSVETGDITVGSI